MLQALCDNFGIIFLGVLSSMALGGLVAYLIDTFDQKELLDSVFLREQERDQK
jgi:hypothetical protein